MPIQDLITMGDLTNRLNPKRAAHSNVRTGCLTCKVRHFKCDEQKPVCRRCVLFGVSCDRYAQSQVRLNRQSRSLAPKSTYAPLLTTLSSSRFRSEDEYRYLISSGRVLRMRSSPVRNGQVALNFLRGCEWEASIRHAVIALGALDKTSQPSRHNGPRPRRNSIDAAGTHYYHALKEYTKAIHYAQTTVKKDLRTALITSLAILSFEAWYGNHDMALQQFKIGMSLLREWNIHYGETSVSGYSTPAPYDVEDVLSPVFTWLTVQLNSSAGNQRSKSLPESFPNLKTDDRVDIKSIPGIFSTFDEAEVFNHAILKIHVDFVSKSRRRTARPGYSTRSYPFSIFSFHEKELMTRRVDRWLTAFVPLRNGRGPQK